MNSPHNHGQLTAGTRITFTPGQLLAIMGLLLAAAGAWFDMSNKVQGVRDDIQSLQAGQSRVLTRLEVVETSVKTAARRR